MRVFYELRTTACYMLNMRFISDQVYYTVCYCSVSVTQTATAGG